jgi:hypothetical protein
MLTAVMDDQLFGALEVDLHVPDDLKSKFAEMTSIIFVDVLICIVIRYLFRVIVVYSDILYIYIYCVNILC